MPLPTNDRAAWPPPHAAAMLRDVTEAAAWYSGDEAALEAVYAASAGVTSTGGRARFWHRRNRDGGKPRQRLHVPAAADVAATGADLLFGDAPTLIIPEAHAAADAAGTVAPKEAQAVEDHLQAMIEEGSFAATILEGAEVAAALGGVYLRPVWGAPGMESAQLTIVHPDRAVPEWSFGRLSAVTFWRELPGGDDKAVWRHLERHEPGVILHGLYYGDRTTLGVRRPLDAHPDTEHLGANDEGAVPLPGDLATRRAMLTRYVPNVRPNRRHRGTPVGRSDYQGCEPLMDALDETWSSWMRDLRLGQARLVVPREFLDRKGRGQGASFDLDAEVFTPLEMDPATMERAGITPVEFKLRVEEHARTALELFGLIVKNAGYAPQTFGIGGDGGGGQTATEVRAREGRSIRTTSRKQRYWNAALADVVELMLVIDVAEYGLKVAPMRPQVRFAELGESDVRDVASTLNLVKLAEAASTETRVRMLHPEWDDAQVEQEAAKIVAELNGPTGRFGDPTGGAPIPDAAAGEPEGDEQQDGAQ